MKKIDILETGAGLNLELEKQPINKERTKVMFELPSDKQDCYGKYVKETIEFLRSLGFEVELKIAGLDNLVINGFEVRGDFDCASTMGYGAWTHKWTERKNRKVTLSWGYKSNICTIPINKEIDKLRLINKIIAAFVEREELEARINKAEEDKINTITALYERYKTVTGFKSIRIEKGDLRINTLAGALIFSADGVVTSFAINFPDFKTLEDLNDFPDKALAIKNDILKAKEEIEALGNTGVTKDTRDASAYKNEEGELKIY